jgi:hypothetical protein
MKAIAKGQGVTNERFKMLSLIKLSCRKPEAARKIHEAMSLIEHEWLYSEGTSRRRLWIEIGQSVIRVIRMPYDAVAPIGGEW